MTDRTNTPDPAQPAAGNPRVLIVRPSALGDVCRTVPVLVSLRRAMPDAQIDWLVQDSFVDAVRHHPALSAAVPFPRTALGRIASVGGLRDATRFAGSLRARAYDTVFDLQGLARSGLISFITGADRRIGFANAREMGWLGYTERYAVDADAHTVDRMLQLVRSAGIEPVTDMTLYTSAADREHVAQERLLSSGNYAVIAPTSRWPGKGWPADRFAQLASALLTRDLAAVVIVGSKSERPQCAPLLELAAKEPRIVDRIGATTVGQLMAIIESARLVIANDSAALHMAVGFSRPIVALFGPTKLGLVGPYRRDADVIQHVQPGDTMDHKNDAAGRALMERITVSEVLAAVDRRLS